MNDKLLELQKPFEKIHFRPKQYSNGKILLLAYLDARDVMDRLDNVFGTDWKDDYKIINDNLYCGISLKLYNYPIAFENGASGGGGSGSYVPLDNKSEWVTRWDCGTESNQDKEKGEASDSFKRAAVKWGIGRYLYRLPVFWVPLNKTGTNYCNIKGKDNQYHTGYYEYPDINKPIVKEPEKTKADYVKEANRLYALIQEPSEKLQHWIAAIEEHDTKEIASGIKGMHALIKKQGENK